MSKSLVNGQGDGLDEPVAFKTVLGLENVDNTADIDKPISALQQAALDDKIDAGASSVELGSIEAPTDSPPGPTQAVKFPKGICDSDQAEQCFIPQWAGTILVRVSAPANASSTGTAGMIAFDSDYVYYCTGVNTWKRVAIATW